MTLWRLIGSSSRLEPRKGRISNGSPSTVARIGGVVEQDQALLGAQLGQCGFKLQSLVDGFVDILLDNLFAPRLQDAVVKPATKPFDPGKADTIQFVGFAVEHAHAGVDENAPNFVLLIRLVVMIAKHRQDRHAHAGQFSHQQLRLFRQAVVGQIATEEQHVRMIGKLRQKQARASPEPSC